MRALCLAIFVAAHAHADARPRYDELAGVATHNSYWTGRGFELGAGGTPERLLDQLLYEDVRALELDIHPRAHEPGVWGVYHTNRESNSSCSPLSECVKQLELLQYLAPRHEVVNVIVELKALWGRSFARGHTIRQLDESFAPLAGALYTPREFLARCRPGATLRECARTAGWPGADSLRGKLIINVLGNWRHDLDDWVDYAASGVGDRVAFPMRTILAPRGLTRFVGWWTRHTFDAARFAAADAASIFWQVGDPRFAGLRRFLHEHGVVRSPYAAPGFQLRQTDRPWELARHGGRDGEDRLRLTSPDASTLATATWRRSAPRDAWETARDAWETAPMMSAAAPRAIGCLRAASADETQSFAICKRVLTGAVARVSLHIRRGAFATVRHFDAGGPAAGLAGDLVALDLEPAGAGSCVVASSASQLRGGRPAWNTLARECFAVALPVRGLVAGGDVVFAGTRRGGVPVAAGELLPGRLPATSISRDF